jgi:hypothetical protein
LTRSFGELHAQAPLRLRVASIVEIELFGEERLDIGLNAA